MRDMKIRTVALLGAFLCACACLVGCGQKGDLPPAPAPTPNEQPAATSTVSHAEVSTTATIEERAHDPVYLEQLAGVERDRQRIMKKRAEIEAKMEQLRAYAKTTKKLPSNATDEQVAAALEGAPLREWYDLVAAMKANIVEDENLNTAAQRVGARRIMRKKAGDRTQGAAPEAK